MVVLHDRYKLLKKLSKKNGRQTLLAQDLTTQQSVVIKTLIFGDEFQWSSLRLFEREAETLKNLEHSAIPCYVDYFELEIDKKKGFALVQSYIAAKSLEQHLQEGRTFSESDIRQLAGEILEILVYLHERIPPVIHRDIKPSNILLSDRTGNSVGQVYLIDFGSVQTAPNTNATYTIVGTYGYMPPEQFSGKADPKSDLYSLGATLIYLVTGKHPADLLQTNLKIQFKPSTPIDSTLVDLFRWLTEPSPEQRPTNARIALDALRQKRKRISQGLPSDLEIFWNTSWRNFLCVMGSRLLTKLPFIFAELISGKMLNTYLFVDAVLSYIFSSIIIAGLTGLVFVRLIRRFHQSQSSDFKAYHSTLARAAALVFIIATIVFDLFINSLLSIVAKAMQPFDIFSALFYIFSALFVQTALSLGTLPSSILFARWYGKRLKKSGYQTQ